MRYKKALIWSAIHDKPHKTLNSKEKTIEGMMPLIKTLFPGINYYSITGFGQVMVGCVVPALKKLFPKLQSVPENNVRAKARVKVGEFLAVKGYEWQESEVWQLKFKKLLGTA